MRDNNNQSWISTVQKAQSVDAGRVSWSCTLRKIVTMSLGDVTEDNDTLIINFEFQNIIKIKIKI